MSLRRAGAGSSGATIPTGSPSTRESAPTPEWRSPTPFTSERVASSPGRDSAAARGSPIEPGWLGFKDLSTAPATMAPLFGRHAQRAVDADRLAVEVAILDDVDGERGVFGRRAEP